MVSIGHVVPVRKRIEIDIPPEYIDKEIEILIHPLEKPWKEKRPKESIHGVPGKKLIKFAGTLSHEDAEELTQIIDAESRWDQTFKDTQDKLEKMADKTLKNFEEREIHLGNEVNDETTD